MKENEFNLVQQMNAAELNEYLVLGEAPEVVSGEAPLTDIGMAAGDPLDDGWDGVSEAVTMRADSHAARYEQMYDVALAHVGDAEAVKRVQGDALWGWSLKPEAVADAENTEDVMGTGLARVYGTGDPGAVWDAMNASADYEYEVMPAWNTRAEGMRLVWQRFSKNVGGKFKKAKALQEERVNAFAGVLRELVLTGDGSKSSGDVWGRFYDGMARGAFRKEDEVAVRRAADAWGMMEGMLGDGTDAGANVLTQGSTGQLIMERLRGDEVAQGLFFSALQARVQDMRTSEQERSFFVRFARAFEAADKMLAAGLMGGHFRAFVSDEEVEAYNAEREKVRKSTGLEKPNVALLAEGDSWLERVLPLGNKRLQAVLKAARDSGQLNEDGSLRRMSEEERVSTQELNEFRGRLFNAVQGVYDVDGFAAKFGKMLPGSLLYVVPGGAAASYVSMQTQYTANELAEGKSWAMASSSGAVNAAIQAAVEKIAFGSLNPSKAVPGMDWLMSRPLMARALGGVYGTTAGRIGMGVALGGAEETFLEPAAGLILGGVYNAVSGTEMQLDSPLEEYRNEMEEMLKPDQLLATALYGLLLGGVNVVAQRDAAAAYRKTRKRLMDVGVDEGRAAQVARMDNALERMQAAQGLINERLKVDAKGVLGYVAELYPQMQEMATVENYFDKGMLPKILPAEKEGMVKVQMRDADGEVQESVMSDAAARLLVEARLEELDGKEQAEMADMVLANAMVGKVSKDAKRWAVSVEDAEMNHEYFLRLARAAGLRLKKGAKPTDIDAAVHPSIPLGQLVGQGAAWEQRMKVARHEYEQKYGEVSDAQWKKIAKRMVSRVNRMGVRGEDGRKQTLLRVARGGFGAMEVLEDVTEDNLVRDMEMNGRTLDYYVSNIKELESAMGKPGAFLRELKDGETAYDRLAVVEAMGKLVQSKVLADTARKGNGLSAALNAFLDLIRSWVLQAKALMKLGAMLNKALSDKATMEKLEPEFLADVDRLVAQDVEFLRELQLADGLEALQRVQKASSDAKADKRVKRRRMSESPVVDKAMAEKGDAVRKEIEAKDKKQAEVDADVALADAAMEGDFSSSVFNQEEMQQIKAAAEKAGTFMKAPNGKPSKLTEHQWLQVRTKAFKGWFGDWERAAELTFKVESITQKEADAELQKLAQIPLMNDGEYGVPAEVNRDQREKLLCNTARRKSEANGFSKEEHFFLASKIQKLYKYAVCLGDYKDVNGARNVLAIRRFAAPFVVNGKRGYALLTVKLTERNSRQRGGVVVTNKEARAYSIELDELRGIDSQLQRMESLRMEKMVAFGKIFEPGGTVGNVVSQDSPSPGSEEIVNAFNAKVKEYFEDISKVVDANGEPLVVYHGTVHGGFRVFDVDGRGKTEGAGAFFTSDKRVAEGYSANFHTGGVTPEVYACFLNIREPHEVDFNGNSWNRVPDRASGYFVHYDNGDSEWFSNKADADFAVSGYDGKAEIEEDWEESPTLDDLAREVWEEEPEVDGIIARNVVDTAVGASKAYPATDFIVASPNQIKSATDNRGTFDGSNPDITYSVTGGKNLAAVHSIPVDTMLDVEKKLGGLPKPSIAITRLDKPYSWGYSERVYLIGKPELADPQKGNLVYDRDAWTGKGPFLLEDGGAYDYRKGEYFEPTLEEFVARTIKKKGQEDGSSFRGQSAVAIGTLDAVKAHREKLSDTDTSNAQKAETDEALEELIENVVKLSKKGLNEDAVAMVLARVCWRSSPMNHGAPSEMKTSRDTAKRILNELGVRVKDIKKPLVDSFMKAVAGLQNELEDYLESVPQRAVMFNEWEYAVMPESMKGTPGLDEMLERNDIKPLWHDGTEEGRRAALAGLVDDPVVSFSVIGRKAKTWDKYVDRAFAGRDDGMWRAEIDASQAKLKWEDLRGKNVAAYRKLVAGWDELPEDVRRKVEAYAEEVYDWQEESDKLNSTPESEFLEQYNKVQKMRDAIKPKREEMRSLLNKLFVEHGGSAGAVLNMKSGELDELVMSLWGPYVEDKVEKLLDTQPLWHGGMRLADVMDYPELYEAYPELADVVVRYAGMETANGRAIYGNGEPEIQINRNLEGEWKKIHSILLHEIQHHIQYIEGFAKGGNPKSARQVLKDKLESMQGSIDWLVRDLRWFSAVEIARDLLKEARMLLKYPNAWKRSGQRFRFAKYGDSSEEVREKIVRDVEERYNEFLQDDTTETLLIDLEDYVLPHVQFSSLVSIEAGLAALDKAPSRKLAFRGTAAKKSRKLADLQKRHAVMKNVLSEFGYEPYELYLRLAGEIEARNVQHRMDWSADKRAELPFNETLEYPGEALVTFSVQRKRDLTLEDVHVTQEEAWEHLEGLEGKPLRNARSKFVAVVNKPQRKELTNDNKAKMSAKNGFSKGAHYAAVSRIESLFEHAVPCGEYPDLKHGEQTVHIHRFACPMMIDGEKAVAWLTAKQTTNVEGSERLYNLELVDIEKLAVTLEYLASHRLDTALRPASGDIVAEVEEAFKTYFEDESFSMINLDEQSLAADVVAAGQGFRANLAFSNQIVKEMRDSLQRMKRLGSKSRTEREDAIAAMGTMVHVVKAAVAYLPKGYRFSVHPYLKKLEVLAELATTGNLELTAELNDFATRPIKEFVRVQQGLHDVVAMKGQGELEADMSTEELLKEYGEAKLTDAMERIMHRVAEQLRKHAKDKAVQKIEELVERLRPKKDKKTGKLKGGKMSADAYRDLDDVYVAMNMSAEQLEAKLAELNAKLNKPGISEDERMQVEGELMLYDQFGDLKGMSAEAAVEAYEALRQRVWFHRFEWENVMAERRAVRRAVVRRVVDGVGSVSENEYNAKKRMVKPGKRLKHLGDILSGLPAVLRGLKGYLPLREMANDLALRANRAGEQIKAWESERWVALEALSRDTMGKSWRLCMDDMHKVQPTGVAFDRPKYRTVSYRTDGLRVLLEMGAAERRKEMQVRREAGGKVAETVLSEKDIAVLAEKLKQMEAEVAEADSNRKKVPSTIEVRYLAEMQHEENLELSRGEALYAILMYEQPTYTERMEAQGYTPEVIAGLREFVGEGMLQFGYGLRELFAKQGDRVAAVYENVYGVPFPREENYFAARWDVTEVKGSPAEQLLAGMSGTPGAGKGWQKQRVNHDLELDMTKDALQVFLQATALTDTWMATQDIVEDFKAWTRDKDFVKAMTVLLGKDGYDNLKDWIRILEMGGVQDCLNMGACQEVINGIYGSGAVAILGFRVQTLLKQIPSIFNGLLGAHDISTVEWFATLCRMKNRTAPMTFRKMLGSTLLENRMQGRAGELKGQAMRSGDMRSSMAEELLLASMLPMEWTDACGTAVSLVPVWNVYYQRAIEKNASVQEAERMAWEQTAEVANLSSQPIGWLNKSKISQSRNPIVRSFFYMLSENTAKLAMSRALWRGGKKKAAVRAWLMYGAANAAISALLDYLQGDPEKWEKGYWWEHALSYAFSALYGPLASVPGVGELVEAVGTGILNVAGHALDVEALKKARTSASIGRAMIDFQGAYRAVEKIWEFATDDKEHGLAEYTRAMSTVSRFLAIGTGWMGNAAGYWNTVAAVLMNPIDFGARVYRNMKEYYGD